MFTNNEEIKATVGAQFHCAKAPGGSTATISRSVAALLLGALFFAPQAVQAQPCAGTTITPVMPATPSGVDVTCDNGTTTVDITTVLGSRLEAVDTANSVQLIGSGSGPVVINNAGGWTAFGDDFGTIIGGVDVAGNSGDVTLNNAAEGGSWSFRGDHTTFGSGSDTVNNAGLVMTSNLKRAGVPNDLIGDLLQSTADFGTGQDAFNNAGTLLVGGIGFGFDGGSSGQIDGFLGPLKIPVLFGGPAAETEFENLEAFNNSGLIVLGGYISNGRTAGGGELGEPRVYTSDAFGEAYCGTVLIGTGAPDDPPDGYLCTDSPAVEDTDREINDVLLLPGTTFTGSGNSTILMDAVFGNGVAQSNCLDRVPGADAVGNELNRLPGADCVDISNGETAGSTQIIIRDAVPSHQGASNPEGIVIVDVSGGTSSAEHFTLSPASDNYGVTGNGRGVIDKGLFVFPLIYDASTQQHKLVGIPGNGAFQMPLLAQAAQDLARGATASGLDERQAKLGAALRADAELSGGFWGNLSHDTAERDVLQDGATVAGESFVFNNDFDQDSTTLTLGRDFIIPAAKGSAWLWGGSIGYVRSDVSFDATPNDAVLEGVAVGLHGGYQTGAWFVNAAFNQAFLQVDHFAPTYDLGTEDDNVHTKAQTQSLYVEGGHRFALTDALHIEPLASLSWVNADFDDLKIESPENPLATSNTVEYDNAASLRAGLGARLTLDTRVSGLNVNYALTGRVWNESDGETDVTIKDSKGSAVPVSDTFDGTFTEVQAGVTLSNADDSLSGFLNVDGGFGDDYDSLGAEVGFRYQW